MMYGRARWQEAQATRKIFQYCTDPSGEEILYLRALQGHLGRNPIGPTLQDTVDSEQRLRVHFSYWMRSQCTLHHKSRIDCGSTTF